MNSVPGYNLQRLIWGYTPCFHDCYSMTFLDTASQPNGQCRLHIYFCARYKSITALAIDPDSLDQAVETHAFSSGGSLIQSFMLSEVAATTLYVNVIW